MGIYLKSNSMSCEIFRIHFKIYTIDFTVVEPPRAMQANTTDLLKNPSKVILLRVSIPHK